MPAAHHRSHDRAEVAASSSPEIRVEVVNQTEALVDLDRIASAVRFVLSESVAGHAAVSVAIVDDPTIHRLNRQFLEHDYPTDVLSFVLEESPRLEGEIVASADAAAREAAAVGWPTADELLLYIVHGALHLSGQRDESPADAAAMRAAELSMLTRLGVTVSPGDARWRGGDAASPGDEATA